MANNLTDYGDYLVKEQEKEQKAATQPSPSVSVGSDYGAWLETMAKNHKVENTPTNAKTYADYLAYIGSDPVGDYRAKVRQAELDYAKGLATYGQNAEKMAKSGLVGSGYGEYLAGLAYTQKQSAVGEAQKTALGALNKGKQTYADYLTSLKSTNEQNAISGIIGGLLVGDEARNYALKQGVTSDRLDAILSEADTEVKNQITTGTDAAYNQLASMIEGGMTLEGAKAALTGSQYDRYLPMAVERYQKTNAGTINTVIKTATGVANYKASLDQQLASGAIDRETYNAQLAAGYDTNYRFVQKALSGDFSGLSQYASDNGLDISEGSEDQINAVIDQMASNGVITQEQRGNYYANLKRQSIEETEYSAKDAIREMEELHKLVENGKISESNRGELYKLLGEKAAERLGEITINKVKDTKNSGFPGISIAFETEKKGKESIKVDLYDGKLVEGKNFVEGKTVTCENMDTVVTFGTINGKVAYKVTKGGKTEYFQAKNGTPDYVNSQDNAAFLAYMMTP